ncbi:MAG: hypothetical protein ACXVCV_21045, partial [Polyangia bacterium]
PAKVKATDIGGPLKKDFPPPPLPGFDVSGKPIEPPDKLKLQLQKQQLSPVGVQPPRTLVPQKTVRVQSAVKPDPNAPPAIGPNALKKPPTFSAPPAAPKKPANKR